MRWISRPATAVAGPVLARQARASQEMLASLVKQAIDAVGG